MARLLAIDWDQDQLQIAAVSTSRKGVTVDKTLAWPLPAELAAASGEELGHKLRDALKAAGIAPAPVVACLGRERVVAKELRYPPVSAAEEPALVRFQAAKELSELPDDVVIDYAPLSAPDQPGERHALAVALKKTTTTAWQALARGLGVKLLALTSRSQALVGAVARAQADGQTPTGETLAVLFLGKRWAELTVIHRGRVLFARSLANGPALAGEIKRNLAFFSAGNVAVLPPTALLLTGKTDADLAQRLPDTVGLPVQRLDPVLKTEAVSADQRDLLTAALGAAHLWARTESLPINFAAPKQPVLASDPDKRRKIVLAATAAVLLVAGLIFANRVLANRQAEIVNLGGAKAKIEDRYKKLAQDRLDIEALKDWEDTSISWLDEFYDLAARFPYQVGLRVKDLQVSPISRRNTKDRFVAQIAVTGVAKTEQDKLVSQFIDSINADKYLHTEAPQYKNLGNGNTQFEFKIDVAKRPANKYQARLTVPPRLKTAPGMEPAEEETPDTTTEDPDDKGGAP